MPHYDCLGGKQLASLNLDLPILVVGSLLWTGEEISCYPWKWWQGSDITASHHRCWNWTKICIVFQCTSCAVTWLDRRMLNLAFMDSLLSGILNFWAVKCAILNILIVLSVAFCASVTWRVFDNTVCHKQIIYILGKGLSGGQKEGKIFVFYNHVNSGVMKMAFTCFCQVWRGCVELLCIRIACTVGNSSIWKSWFTQWFYCPCC